MTRPLLKGLGLICVGLGIVGIFVPLLPTTPFLLLALWAFSKSSPALASWLRNHHRLGPYVRDWQDYGAIPPKAKVLAIVMMTASYSWLQFGTAAPVAVKIAVAIILAGVAIFIISRPSKISL